MGIWENDAWRLVKSSPERVDAINIVLSAFRSQLASAGYTSMPITTGELYYQVLESYGVLSLEELKKIRPAALFEEIIRPNVNDGIAFANRVSDELQMEIIAPCIFEANKQRWTQDEYMFMWFRVIEERAQAMLMKPGWQYSNGGCEEIARALEMKFGFINPLSGMEYVPAFVDREKLFRKMTQIKIMVWDKQLSRWREIEIEEISRMIADAIIDLWRRMRKPEQAQAGFKPLGLLTVLDKIASIAHFFGSTAKLPPYIQRGDFDRQSVIDVFHRVVRRAEDLSREYLAASEPKPHKYSLLQAHRLSALQPFGSVGGSYELDQYLNVTRAIKAGVPRKQIMDFHDLSEGQMRDYERQIQASRESRRFF